MVNMVHTNSNDRVRCGWLLGAILLDGLPIYGWYSSTALDSQLEGPTSLPRTILPVDKSLVSGLHLKLICPHT